MPKRKNTQNSAQSNGPTRKNKNKKDENFETEKSHFKTLCQWMVDHIFPILENVKVSKNSEKFLDHLLNVTSEDFMEDKLVDFLFYGADIDSKNEKLKAKPILSFVLKLFNTEITLKNINAAIKSPQSKNKKCSAALIEICSEIYHNFVISFALYFYCILQSVKNNENIAQDQICMFCQIEGGAGICFEQKKNVKTILTARHVISEKDCSCLGYLRVVFVKDLILLVKCVKERKDPCDLAVMVEVDKFDVTKYFDLLKISKNSKITDQKMASHPTQKTRKFRIPRRHTTITCFGYPSIIHVKSDYGPQKHRDGPEKLVYCERDNLNYVAWEPPMWNSVSSNYLEMRNGINFYHGAIKYGGFSGGPILDGVRESLDKDKNFKKISSDKNKGFMACGDFIGLHHGWEPEVSRGVATQLPVESTLEAWIDSI